MSSSVHVCFHGVGEPGRTLEQGEASYWVGHPTFLAILDEVAGWPGATLSFDDGNASDVELALPALRERGLTATFFVLAGRLDTAGSLRTVDVRTLVDAGMSIGSHGMDHATWRRMPPALEHRELVEARQLLQDITGGPVEDAACPRGQYDRSALAALKRLGYRAVYTSDRRAARSGAWLRPRFSVTASDTPAGLRRAVWGQGRPGAAVSAAKTFVKRLR